jgi:hypothetical protein
LEVLATGEKDDREPERLVDEVSIGGIYCAVVVSASAPFFFAIRSI